MGRMLRVGDYVRTRTLKGYVIDRRTLSDILRTSENAPLVMERVRTTYQNVDDYQEVLIEDERGKIRRWFHTLEVEVVRRHGERKKETVGPSPKGKGVPSKDSGDKG